MSGWKIALGIFAAVLLAAMLVTTASGCGRSETDGPEDTGSPPETTGSGEAAPPDTPGDETDGETDGAADPPAEDDGDTAQEPPPVEDTRTVNGLTIAYKEIAGRKNLPEPPEDLALQLWQLAEKRMQTSKELRIATAEKAKMEEERAGEKDPDRRLELMLDERKIRRRVVALNIRLHELRSEETELEIESEKYLKHTAYRIFLSGEKARFEYGYHKAVVIDLEAGLCYVISPTSRLCVIKKCAVMLKEAVISYKTIREGTGEIIDYKEEHLSERTGPGIIAEENMIAVLKESLKHIEEGDSAVLSITEETRTIDGRRAGLARAKKQNRPFADIWIAQSDKDTSGIRLFIDFVKRLDEEYGTIFFEGENSDLTAFIEGLPVLIEYNTEKGKLWNRTLESFSTGPIRAALFEIPKGYQILEWEPMLPPGYDDDGDDGDGGNGGDK